MNHRPSTAQLRCPLTVCCSLPDKNVSVFVEQDPLLETPVLVWNPPPPWLHAGPGFSPAEQLVGGIAPVASPQITWHMFPGSSIRRDVRGIYHLVFVPRCSLFSSVSVKRTAQTRDLSHLVPQREALQRPKQALFAFEDSGISHCLRAMNTWFITWSLVFFRWNDEALLRKILKEVVLIWKM